MAGNKPAGRGRRPVRHLKADPQVKGDLEPQLALARRQRHTFFLDTPFFLFEESPLSAFEVQVTYAALQPAPGRRVVWLKTSGADTEERDGTKSRKWLGTWRAWVLGAGCLGLGTWLPGARCVPKRWGETPELLPTRGSTLSQGAGTCGRTSYLHTLVRSTPTHLPKNQVCSTPDSSYSCTAPYMYLPLCYPRLFPTPSILPP